MIRGWKSTILSTASHGGLAETALNSISEPLEDIIKTAKPTITAIGLGGAGSNIVTWIKEQGIAGVKLIAAPEFGAESMDSIKEDLLGSDLVFLVAGFGGGTGRGAAPVIAELTRDAGVPTIGCITLPFAFERASWDKSRDGIKKLRKNCDMVVLIDNERLRQVAGDLPLKPALGIANELVGSFVKNITETITLPSLINIDYADLRTIMERGGISSIGIGEGENENRVSGAVAQALATPLLDITNISTSKGVLIHIAGGEDMTLEEVAKVGEMVAEKVPHAAKIAWGARVDPDLEGKVRVMAVLTGVKSTFIGRKKPMRAEKKDNHYLYGQG